MPYSPRRPVQWLSQSRNLELFLLAACACLLTLLCQPIGAALSANRSASTISNAVYPISVGMRQGWAADRA
jgi:hypothetical protein